MRLWLEAQSISVIALIVFGLSYLTATTAFVLARVAARLGWARDFKDIPAMTLMPLAVLLAVLFGFLASRVWANHEHAENYVAQEASALHEIVLMAPAFPADVQTRLHAAVRAHIKAMAEEEWPAMARGEKDVGQTPRVLTEATAMVLDLNPIRPGEQLAQQRVVAAGPSIGCQAQPDHAERRTDRRGPMGRHPRPHDPNPDDRRHGQC